jgi:hypothetical protein
VIAAADRVNGWKHVLRALIMRRLHV